jgi:hypothetical protein
MAKSEVMSFRKDIPPLTTMTILERIKSKGEISEVRIRFYAGQERQLQVRPFVQMLNQQTEDMFTFAGSTNANNLAPIPTDPFLSGDDDYFTFPVNLDVVADDNIAVWVSNLDTNYTYTLVVDVVISYYGA